MLRGFANIRIETCKARYFLLALLIVSVSGFGQVSAVVAKTSNFHIIVARDGGGNYKTIQAAVDSIPANNPNHVVIYIKKGTYHEIVTVPPNKPYITFLGQDEKSTIITSKNYNGKPKPGGGTYGTSDSAGVFIQGDHFTAKNITFQNTAGAVGQAVAINVTADFSYFDSCQFLGWQDTLYAHTGRQYYSNSYITGNVDYVFGNATAVFEKTKFHNLGGNGGTITAQKRSASSETTGFVLNSDIIDGAIANSIYLGRPWGPYARVVVMNSQINSDITPDGWRNWSTAGYSRTAYFAEYNNNGSGSNTSRRVSWSHQLTAQEAKQYATDKFLNRKGWLTSAKQALEALSAASFPKK